MGRKLIDRDRVYSLYENGSTSADIAAEVGGSVAYIDELIMKKYGRRPHKDVGKIKALWRAGWSINMIMDDTHLTEDEVRSVVLKEGEK